MLSAASLRCLDSRALRGILASGHRIEPDALAGFEFHGVSLAQPTWVTKLTWLKFIKAFASDDNHRTLRGWNVRAEQNELDAPWTPQLVNGSPRSFGHFAVIDEGSRLMLDYGQGARGRLDPLRFARDPLVAVNRGSSDLLLGVTELALWRQRIPTQTFFSLERGQAITRIAQPPAQS